MEGRIIEKSKLTFDRNGNPQPPGIINILLDEFKNIYVDDFINSTTRQTIFNKWQVYVSDFKDQISLNFKQWVNGSYVTDKMNPRDIDLVNLIDYTNELNNKMDLISNFLTHGGSKDKYKVDGYFVQIYSPDDARYSLTLGWLNYWKNWFGHDRQKREKALLEISF